MKKYVMFIILLECIINTAAVAEEGGYAAFRTGGMVADDSEVTEEGPTGNLYAPVTELDRSVFFSAAVGYRWKERFRIEGEASYRTSESDKEFIHAKGVFASNQYSMDGRVESYIFMSNFYYDLSRINKIRPFIKAGVGVAFHESEALFEVQPYFQDIGLEANHRWYFPENDEQSFVFSVGAGAAYELSDRITLDAGYNYTDLGEISTDMDIMGDKTTFDLKVHEVYLGVRFDF
ncbi:MAG: outer membrane beta-barrel protein [Candidatus Electrothrix sp.]